MSDKSPTQRREQFRAILAGDLCVHPASVFDPISARIAEDLGFGLDGAEEAVYRLDWETIRHRAQKYP